MSLRSKYAKQIRNLFGSGFHAAWLPDSHCEVGTYGLMEDDVFLPKGNLRDLGVTFEIEVDTVPSKISLNASKDVVITVKFSGVTNNTLPNIPTASAGLGIEFKSEGACVIAADEVYVDNIKYPAALESQLRTLKDQGKWEHRYRIVTGAMRMPVAYILISSSSNAKVEISLEGTLTPSVAELGKVGVTGSIVAQTSSVLKADPARNATPVLILHRLAWSPFSPGHIRALSKSMSLDQGSSSEFGLWQLVPEDETATESSVE